MENEPDLFGVAETPPPSPVGGLLNPCLKHGAHGDKAVGLALTIPGMARIADPSLGKRCEECLYWARAARDSWGDLRPAVCNKYPQLTPIASRKAAKDRELPAGNCACHHFEPNPFPPRVGR
jgi:hypothetical protein